MLKYIHAHIYARVGLHKAVAFKPVPAQSKEYA